jgi:hypothetical protein
MLSCSYCNYYKEISSSENPQECNSHICEYANFTFPNNIDELAEYPCNNLSITAWFIV